MKPLCGDTSSDQAVALVFQWLHTCLTYHTTLAYKNGCKKLKEPVAAPKRVVYVGKTNDEIRLLENTDNSKAFYTCLSHCWGPKQPLMTTKATKARHMNGIKWTDLPKTFQDAIDFTRRLRVSFIWIDSLCIVQDDKDDWALESTRMASIYSNAFFTIAAAASSDGKLGPIYAKRQCHPPSPLLQRGWVLQEQLLSQRVVYFCNNDVAFQCASGRRCECGESWADRNVDMLDSMSNYFEDLHEWTRAVEEYSSRKLTFQRDKLPALSGVARTIAERHSAARPGLEYCAGLWNWRWYEQLMWAAESPTKPTPTPAATSETAYVAPSWSWASANGPVKF
ncbi:HET-domain-containing protein, partial [Thozetella sp. PMI_491]